MAQTPQLNTTISTSLALLDQFFTSLDSTNASQSQSQQPLANYPSPLHLLTASATSVKSSVTKLSLLTITTPFTSSAIVSILQPLNTSVLPSLVTATLLASPTIYPQAFSTECCALTRACLRDLKSLLSLVKQRAEDGKPKDEVTDAQKKSVTEATGRIWEDCDSLVKFSNEGLAGFVCRKAKQWLELMKDAVKEFEEWDPEEDVGDDPFGLDDALSDDGQNNTDEAEKDTDRAAMSAGVKDQALKVLSRIPQSIHVVVKQRLEKIPKDQAMDPQKLVNPISTGRRKTIDAILKKTRKISECIDESAEGMYMGDLEKCLKKAGEARALTIEVVGAVVEPWEKSDTESKEDQYIKRALAWIQQVEPGGQKTSVNGDAKGKAKA